MPKRKPPGRPHGVTVLSQEQIKRIRALYKFRSMRNTITLAREFDVSQNTIFKVVNWIPPYDKWKRGKE